MRKVLDDQSTVGELKRIVSHFSFRGDDSFLRSNIRAMSQFEPQGCLGISVVLHPSDSLAKNYKMPVKVTGRVLKWFQGEGSRDRVPGECSGEMLYDDGFSASFIARSLLKTNSGPI